MNNKIDLELRARAKAVIPNGMYGHESVGLLPDGYPQFFAKADGAYIWDVDGNRYLDFMCAYGPNLLGYKHEKINAAYIDQLSRGDAMTGPSPMLVELAENFVGMVSHADWAMFAKNGTDVTSMAMVIARAHTGKKKIVLAKGAYHGAAPWCTPIKNGVTEEDRANQIFYDYNDVASLEAAVNEAGDDLAAIFGSPFKHDAFVDQEMPNPAYARRARELCDAKGALLVVDDVRAGFRLARDCSWSLVGVQPDLSAWGKLIANGHPISALLGSEKAREAAGSIYVTGSYWFAGAAMAAAVATLKEIRETDYLEHTVKLGTKLRNGLAELAAASGFGLRQTGPVQMPLFLFDDDADFRKGYFWSAELLKHGVYVHPWHNMFLCAAMKDEDIDLALRAAKEGFAALKQHQGALERIGKLDALQAAHV